jgi:3-oxoadipyl-CoA thiolase
MASSLREVLVVDAVRTPVGRYRGALAEVRPDDLGAVVIADLVRRTGVDPAGIDEVILGCANQAGEDNRNVARMSLLLAGLPVSVPGGTVNRLCGSGLEAVIEAARAIAVGDADVAIAGGVESMSRAPLVMAKPREAFPRGDVTMHDSTLGWRFVNPRMEGLHGTHALGETAELVAEKYGVTREAQDAFALASQQRWAAAHTAGRFAAELVPVEIPGRGREKDKPKRLETDEHPRPQTTLAELAALSPAFRKQGGTVTAGNASGINDGAAALLLASPAGLARLARKPLARYVASGVAGVEPRLMGMGPVPATKKALARAGISAAADVDLVELNEAFAAQAIPCVRELGLDLERVNVNGGAIAIGHPLGASGARLVTTLVHELSRRQARFGLASMCIGVGQGISAVFERP